MLNSLVQNPYSNKLREERKRLKENTNILIKERDAIKNKVNIHKLLEKNEGKIKK